MSDESNEPEIIEAEIVDSDNLPAVIEQPESHQRNEPIKGQSARYAAGERDFDRPLATEPRDWETYAEPSRRCVGHKKTGERCKNAAILGSTVCRFHGGAAKHVKAAARARLDNAADLMAKQLLRIAIGSESEAVKLAAVKDALDRTLGKAPTTVEIGPTKPYEEVLTDVFDGISPMTREESRRARGLPVEDDMQPAVGLPENEGLLPPTQPDPANPNQPPNQRARREPLPDPTHDPASAGAYQPDREPEGRRDSSGYDGRLSADRYEGQSEGSEYGQRLARGDRGDRPRRPEFDRQPQPEPPVRHITGDEALAESGRLTRQRIEQERQAQLESRNRRPQRALPPGRSTGHSYGRSDV
ncbi:hypothetical protein ABQF17_15020 [Mycolicibacterium elephantis]